MNHPVHVYLFSRVHVFAEPKGTMAAGTAAMRTAIATIASLRSTTIATVVSSTTGDLSATCLKCGSFRNSGKVSCCARGGSWFNECGDDDDTAFAHTWSDGIKACKSKSLIAIFIWSMYSLMRVNSQSQQAQRGHPHR